MKKNKEIKNDEKIEKNNEKWWKREKTPMKNDEAERKNNEKWWKIGKQQ